MENNDTIFLVPHNYDTTASNTSDTDTNTDTDTTATRINMKYLSLKITPKKFSFFICMLFLVYITNYLLSIQLQWEVHKKSLAKHYTDIFLMYIFSIIIYIFSNMQETFNIYSVIGIWLGTLGIAFIGNLPGFNFEVDSLKQVGTLQIIVVGLFLLLLLIMILLTLKQYKDKSSLLATFCIVSIPLIIILLSYLIYLHETKINKNKQEYHFHHWQWSIPFIFLFRIPNHFISSFTSGVLIGIFIDGISRYGPDSIYST